MRYTQEHWKVIEEEVCGDEVLQLARQLVKIPSVFTKEQRISDFVRRKLDGWGLETETVPVEGHGDCVVASFGPRNGKAVAFNGHMDTVGVMDGWKHDPFAATVEAGRLYGLGSLDMKSGLASMMIAFRTLSDSRMAKGSKVVFHAVTGEEDLCIGTTTLTLKGKYKGVKAAIVGEGFGGLGAVTVGRRGGTYWDIEVIGKSAHGASPHLGINAVTDAARLIEGLEGMEMKASKGLMSDDFKPLFESQTVLRVNGGGVSLSVPERCSLTVTRCTIPEGKVDARDDIIALVKRLGLRSKVIVKTRTGPADPLPPHLTDRGSELVKAAAASLQEFTRKPPRLVCGVSEADDNVIAFRTGVPVICMGPGERGKKARYHQPEESIGVSQLGTITKAYCATVLRLAE